VVVLVIGAAGAAIFLNSGSHSTSSSTTSSTSSTSSQSVTNSSAGPFKVESLQLIVGYQGGLFSVGFQDVAGKSVESLVVILSTPTQAALCTGAGYGLQFANCVPGPGKTYVAGPSIASGNFAANATFTGFATGTGPGSATVGQSYTVTITANWVDKTTTTTTLSVQATAGN
jgi:hypothetical protein